VTIGRASDRTILNRIDDTPNRPTSYSSTAVAIVKNKLDEECEAHCKIIDAFYSKRFKHNRSTHTPTQQPQLKGRRYEVYMQILTKKKAKNKKEVMNCFKKEISNK
jgi:hypothetical protein